MTDDTNTDDSNSLGAFIRAQRELANLSVRQLSTMSEISNAYLSQIERDLHQPSLRVLKNVGEALGIAPKTLLTQAGLIPDGAEDNPTPTQISTEEAILADPLLSSEEKQALLSVYRSYRASKN
jgi:transcriptional regulator with XRE-family HTH domain